MGSHHADQPLRDLHFRSDLRFFYFAQRNEFMMGFSNRLRPYNPITQTLDRIIEAERLDAEARAARAARRKSRGDVAATPGPATGPER
ncbi:hypothetical protein [Bosea sp. WAO]|uniref:hypothetical protein n=1 Tax=Bosea sp. WAO TaxID=406341 RepID=UPI0012ED597C|nr:hypothetical protein [Bosea sp. WAO]